MLKVGQPIIFIQPLGEKPFNYCDELPVREYPALVASIGERLAVVNVVTNWEVRPRAVRLQAGPATDNEPGWRHVE